MVASLILGVSAPYFLGHLIYHIPVLNIVRLPSRAAHIYALGIALMAASSIDYLAAKIDRSRIKIGTILSLVVVSLIGAEAYNFVAKQLAPINNPAYPMNSVYNDAMVKEILRVTSGPDGSRYRVHFPADSLPSNLGDIFPILTTTAFRSSRQINYHDYFDWKPDSPCTDALAVKWWVSEKPVAGLREIAYCDNMHLYERPKPLPVFWMQEDDGSRIPAPIASTEWTQNTVTVRFDRKITGSLVFAQPSFPGWKFIANGRSSPCTTVDIFMTAKLLEPCDSVTFRYAPLWFTPLLIISLVASAGVLLLGCGLLTRKAPPVHGPPRKGS